MMNKKKIRVYAGGTGPVAKLTGRAGRGRESVYAGTGGTMCRMNGAGRGRGTFRKIICGTRRGGFANPTGRVPRGIKISCPAHLCILVEPLIRFSSKICEKSSLIYFFLSS